MKKAVVLPIVTSSGTVDIVPIIKAKRLQSHLACALAFSEKGMVSEAIKEWNSAIKLDGNNPEHHLALALAYMDSGKTKKAARHFEKVLRFSPLNTDALGCLGIIAFENGDLTAAVKYFEKVIKLKPGDRETLIFLSETLQAMGLLSEASEIAEKAYKLYPRDSDVFIRKALILEAYGNFQEALKLLRSSLLFNPNHGLTYYTIGMIYLSCDWLDFAINAFRRACDYMPEPEDALIRLATALLFRRETAEACEVLNNLLVINPNSIQGLTLLANIYLISDKLNESEAVLDILIKSLKVKSANIFAMKGMVFFKKGSRKSGKMFYKKAEKMFVQALKFDPDSSLFRLEMTRAVFYSGDYPRALSIAEENLKKEPANFEIYHLMADIYEAMDFPVQARECRRFALLLETSTD